MPAKKAEVLLDADEGDPILYFVDGSIDEMVGPFSDPATADLVSRIINLTVDDSAAVVKYVLNPWQKEIKAGLKPFSVVIESSGGIIKESSVKLTWPPEERDCKVLEQDGYVQYFVWATSQGDAVRRIGALAKTEAIRTIGTQHEVPEEFEGVDEEVEA